MIYFDHAATTPLDEEVFQKTIPYFTQNFGNPDSSHSFGRKAMAGVDFARDTTASLFGCKPNEIYFTSGGSEGNTWAIKSAVECYQEKGRHIVVSSIEHPSVLHCCKRLEERGVEVSYLPVDENGVVSVASLERVLRPDTVMVGVMIANNETGVLQDIPALSAAAKRRGALFFTDCVQYAGGHELPVQYADIISVSSHKFYGPKGAGALYIKNGTKISPLIFGGEQERGLRGGTTNVAGVYGMACALQKARAFAAENNRKIKLLRDYFEDRVAREIPDIRVNACGAERIENISNISFFGAEGTALLFRLDLKGIAASLGSACASGSLEPSHVLKAMGLSDRQASSSVRFSFGRENTFEEADFAVEALKETVRDLRK